MLKPAESLLKEIRSKLSNTEMIALEQEYQAAKKHPILALVLSFFLGAFAIDRFYIGTYTIALFKLLAMLICAALFWLFIPLVISWLIWLVDLLKIMKVTETRNIKKLEAIYAKALRLKSQLAQPL